MNRDWTPIEHYLSEQRQIKMGWGDLFDFLENLKMQYNGKEEMCCSPEEIAIRRQFPQLGRLLMNYDFMVLYEKLSKIDHGLELLHEKDEELANFIAAMKIVNESGRNIVKVDDIGIDRNSYLIKWFVGTLDENFYYSERNNQMFVEAVVQEAKWKIWFESFDKDGNKTGSGVLSEEYSRKSSAMRRIKQLDQEKHRWTVSRTNPYIQENIRNGEKGALEDKIHAASAQTSKMNSLGKQQKIISKGIESER